MPTCSICSEPASFACISGLSRHLELNHHSMMSGVLRCMEPNCLRLTSNWRHLRRHLIRDHKIPIYVNFCHSRQMSVDNAENVSESVTASVSSPEPDSVEVNAFPDESDDVAACTDVVLSQLTSIICKLYANPSIPRNHVQHVVEDIRTLLHETVTVLGPSLMKIVKKTCSDDEKEHHIDSLLGAVVSPLEGVLSTEHLRFKYLRESNNFVEAEDYIVGDRCDEHYRRGRMVLDRVSVSGKYIPVKNTLSKFLSLPGVLEKIKLHHSYLEDENSSGFISNFVQCKLWKEKLKSFHDKFVIPIFLYFDDFEVSNPLGSHAGIHKLGGVYYSLPSLPPEFQSSIDSVFLTLIFHASDRAVAADGNSYVFRKLLEDLNDLSQQGITVSGDGISEKVYVCVGLLLADNKGFHEALGFAGGFNANYYCRFCKGMKCSMRSQLTENTDLLRKVEDYVHDVGMGVSNSGVSENSIWNSLTNFHVYQNFSVDIFHDLLEGVCKTDMSIIIQQYISAKKMSLESLNARINSFNYTLHGLKNKPPSLSLDDVRGGNLKMSATEMFHFVLLFSFYVGDLLGSETLNDPYWQLYLNLREIMDIAFAKTVIVEHVKRFRSLVEQHHRLRVEKLESPLKPKDHFLLHYSLVMEMSGPVAHLSTAKFESKHKLLKAMSNSTSSRVNITQSICVKEQLNFCYKLACKEGLQLKIEMGPGEHYSEPSLIDSYAFFSNSLPDEFNFKPCITVPWIKYKGVNYRRNSVVAVGNQSESYQVFGSIETIILTENNKVCLVCRLFETDSFDVSMHSYTVSNTCTYKCVAIDSLSYPFLVIYHVMPSGQGFITLKHL